MSQDAVSHILNKDHPLHFCSILSNLSRVGMHFSNIFLYYYNIMIVLILFIIYLVLLYLSYNKKEGFHNTIINEFYTNKPKISSYNIKNKIKYTLKSGECLYIPRNWHYTIKAYPNTRAYSVWFNKYYNGIPYKLDEILDIDLANDVINKILATKKYTEVYEQYKHITKYKEEDDDKKTLCILDANYSHYRYIIDNLYPYLEIPQILTDMKINKENFNFWYSQNGGYSGLQLNRLDSIICVLDGFTEIILFNNNI